MKRTLFSTCFCVAVFMMPFLNSCEASREIEFSRLSSLQLHQANKDKPSVPLSSEGATTGITLQSTLTYRVKSPPEPKAIGWTSRKLFSLRQSQTSLSTLTGPRYQYHSLIAKDGTLYFSVFVGDGYLFALDSLTGAEKKALKLKDTTVSPLTVAGDYVFFGTGDGKVLSFDRDTWDAKWQVANNGYRFDVGSPLVAEGILLIGGAEQLIQQSSRAQGSLHALNAMTGDQLWMVKVKGFPSSPAVDEGTVYFADQDNHLLAVDLKTGRRKWNFTAAHNIHTHAVTGDRVYFADTHGDLYSADKTTGQLAWKADKVGRVRSALAVNNGMIFYGGNVNSVYAIDASSGVEKWRFQTRSSCSAPVIAGGVLFFVSADRFLYAVDGVTGKEKWKYKCKNQPQLSPTITDAATYLLDDEGYVFSLR